MGMVTDVKWDCPDCGEANIAQLYDDHYFDASNPVPIPHKAVPSDADLKWNPACEGCGKYRLVEPPVVLVEFPIARVPGYDDGS